MASEFLQNSHDHPLYLIFSGNNCSKVINMLQLLFSPLSSPSPLSLCSHQLQATSLSAMMGELMPFHFSHRDQEYFVFGYVRHERQEDGGERDEEDEEVLIAVNHRYHDIASLALILNGAEWPTKFLVPDGVKKRTPHPLEFRGFKPTTLSTLRLSNHLVDKISKKFHISKNMVLFWITVSAISCQPISSEMTSQHIMCLHSLRKSRHQSVVAGGDYSAYVTPYEAQTTSHSIFSLSVDILPSLEQYFQSLRSCSNVLTDQPSLTEEVQWPMWIFDTWVGTDIARPNAFNDSNSKFELNDKKLMEMYSMLVFNFVLAIDYQSEYHLHFFADHWEKTFPSNVDEEMEKLLI